MARKYSRKASADVGRAMKKGKAGTLKSGRSGRKVKSRKQAIAIGLSEARAKGKKVPKKAKKRKVSKKKKAKKSKREGCHRHCLRQTRSVCAREQSDEAIQNPGGTLDCFASLAMTVSPRLAVSRRRAVRFLRRPPCRCPPRSRGRCAPLRRRFALQAGFERIHQVDDVVGLFLGLGSLDR